MISTDIQTATSSAIINISEADKVKQVVGELAIEVLAVVGAITLVYLIVRGLLAHRTKKVPRIK